MHRFKRQLAFALDWTTFLICMLATVFFLRVGIQLAIRWGWLK